MKKTVSIVAGICLVFALFGGTLIANAETSNQQRVRTAEVRDATSADDSLLLDVNGETPEQVLVKAIDAANAGDWQSFYDLTAYTAFSYEQVRADFASSSPRYSDFTVLQTDFIQLDASKYARVLVSCKISFTDNVTGELTTLTREGDWLTVDTEDGIWKPRLTVGRPGSTMSVETPLDLPIVLDFQPQPSIHSVVTFTD